MTTDTEWRQKLTPEQFRVLRQHGTERPFTSPLNDEHRVGVFVCAACALELFRSDTKFDSGTGWPSFFAPIADATETSRDFKLILPRTEVHCSRCGGHLGHVFDDGPQPTGKRYCMNGVAMQFKPDA
jgi:peptide-methionine (R)-S-oxide reductase